MGAAIMAALVGTASARSLSTSNETLRATWARLSFREPVFGVTVVCPLTLEGSLHGRTIAKGTYNLIGYITKAIFGSAAQCTGGGDTILTETLPWHVRYQSFTNTLPDIRTIRALMSRMSFRLRIDSIGATCLFTTRETVAEHGLITFNRDTTTRELTSAEINGEITSNEACVLGSRVREILISGPSTSLTVLNSSSRITLNLI
jgi:hypothetical protein